MNHKIFLCLFALSLQIGCGGGGGITGAGTGNVVLIDGLLLTAHMTAPNDTISIDAFHSLCPGGGMEDGLMTHASIFTVEVTNVSNTTGLLNPVGVTFTDYTVYYDTITYGAPELRNRLRSLLLLPATGPPSLGFIPLRSSISGDTPVIIADVDAVMPEFREYWAQRIVDQGGTLSAEGVLVYPDDADLERLDYLGSYTVTVKMRGQTLSGKNFTISARQYIEIGEFNRCDQ